MLIDWLTLELFEMSWDLEAFLGDFQRNVTIDMWKCTRNGEVIQDWSNLNQQKREKHKQKWKERRENRMEQCVIGFVSCLECRSGTSSRQPDVCVKLLLLTHTGQELGRAKTSLKKSQQAPTFLELFMFQVAMAFEPLTWLGQHLHSPQHRLEIYFHFNVRLKHSAVGLSLQRQS